MGTVHEPTAHAVHLTLRARGSDLAIGTGFHVGYKGRFWLITAGHNLLGRDYLTGEVLSKKTGATPNTVGVRHTWANTLGQWTEVEMSLFDDEGRALWIEHPVHGRMVDVVALEVPHDRLSVATIYAWNLEQAGLAQLSVPDDVSIIGFPFGITGGSGFAIWSRGTVATELDFDHDGLPMFLVDSRTRSGQSGAPVFWYSSHGLVPVRGGWMLNDGKNPPMALLGLYSGRVNPQSDLGRVFTLNALREVIDGAVRSDETWID